MFTKTFWKQTAERGVKSFAQALLLFWGADSFDVLHVNWSASLGLAGGAVVLSVLTSIVSLGLGAPNSPSLVSTKAAS